MGDAGPRCLPEEHPRLVNGAERQVWDALREQCGPDDLIVAGQRITDHAKDFEIDVILVLADGGVVSIEVKGGEITHDGSGWHTPTRRIDPVNQVRDAKYALRSYVTGDPRWGSRGRVRWAHLVVLPHTQLPEGFALPECPRWSVVDRTQLGELVGCARTVLRQQESGHRPTTAADVDVIAEILAGRGLPQRDVVARALENEDASDALTEEQMMILRVAQEIPRIEVRGGAGSGKTFLACEQARRLTKAGQRVALLCCSHGLASYLRRLVAGWPRKDRPAYVGEFHTLGLSWGADEEPADDASRPQFFEHDLPAQMTALAEGLAPGQRFDAIVVDEAQDFADDWWAPLLAALVDPDTGGLSVFSDEGQRVFERYGRPPVPLVPLVLDANLRNTRQIAQAFGPLVRSRMRLRGADGPAVRFVDAGGDVLGAADDAVEELLEAGWRPQDVALLTTGSRHPEQIERQADGFEAYWESFWDAEQVFYGHVLGFKGLERRAVVLALNSGLAASRLRERVYVGLSRARDELAVCGDPAVVRAVGGDELAKRLGC
ncbi:MAG: NERD domain-containing protein [Mycobacteriaceae bacterium]